MLLSLLKTLKNAMNFLFRLSFPANLDAARNKQTTDSAPNKSTAHRVTSNDDDLRASTSDEYVEGGHEVPLPAVLLELEYYNDIVAYYEKRDVIFFRQLLPLLITINNAMKFLFCLFFWN